MSDILNITCVPASVRRSQKSKDDAKLDIRFQYMCNFITHYTTCCMHDYDVQKNSVLYLIIVSGTSKSLHAWWHCLMLASVLLISQTFMFTVSFVYRGYVNFIVDSNCCDPLNVRVSPCYQGMRQCRHWLQFHEDLCPSPVCDSDDSEHIK